MFADALSSFWTFIRGIYKGIFAFVAFAVVPSTIWYTTVNFKLQSHAHAIESNTTTIADVKKSLDRKKDRDFETAEKILDRISAIDSRLSRIEGQLKRIDGP